MRHHQGSRRNVDAVADALGWFSIGLGAMEILAPRALGRRIGLRKHDRLLRFHGAREIATGIGILTAPRERKPLWLWGRVAGDALDLATLAAGMTQAGPHRRQRAALAMGALVGVTALDALCAWKLGEQAQRRREAVRDYSGRRGFPAPAAAMRGRARDGALPKDMLTPEALRPWRSASGAASFARPGVPASAWLDVTAR